VANQKSSTRTTRSLQVSKLRMSTSTMIRHTVLITTLVLLASLSIFAQATRLNQANDVAFWVDHWAHPQVALFGPWGGGFQSKYENRLFPVERSRRTVEPCGVGRECPMVEGPSQRTLLRSRVCLLSQRRADWVRQALVGRGISDNRIKVAAGCGELYPVCPEENDECWSKNRLVRFVYSSD
jgi:hypothetical protein